MGQPIVDRRLAAILADDVVGYSRPMQLDEAGTLAAITPTRFLPERQGCMCNVLSTPTFRFIARDCGGATLR